MAMAFEAVKIALKQDRNGHVLTLVIHPNETPDELWRSPTGQRYGVALVPLDEVKMMEQIEAEGSRIYKMFGARCRDKMFQSFVFNGNIDPLLTKTEREERTRAAMKKKIGVVSSKDLMHNTAAQTKFLEIVNEYEQASSY